MKALLLAGGQGTRLRPLTIHTPKPVVPIFARPFLHYQLDLLRRLPDLDEVILSLNYQPKQIADLIGDGSDMGIKIRYLVEPEPLGTAGAVKYAEQYLDAPVIVFNGDVLTQIDLAAVVQLHRERGALATIVLTPVENPTAYGLVETDADSNVTRFLEKPDPQQITCNTINAGIYVLEPATLDRIPKATNWSIERSYFPSLVERKETFVAYVYGGYWIDIGSPAKYMQVHRDIMDGRLAAAPFAGRAAAVHRADGARVSPDASIEGPCFIDRDSVVEAGARVRPYAVLGSGCHVGAEATVGSSIVWPNSRIGRGSILEGAILGRHCQVGTHAVVKSEVVLGDRSVVADYSRL